MFKKIILSSLAALLLIVVTPTLISANTGPIHVDVEFYHNSATRTVSARIVGNTVLGATVTPISYNSSRYELLGRSVTITMPAEFNGRDVIFSPAGGLRMPNLLSFPNPRQFNCEIRTGGVVTGNACQTPFNLPHPPQHLTATTQQVVSHSTSGGNLSVTLSFNVTGIFAIGPVAESATLTQDSLTAITTHVGSFNSSANSLAIGASTTQAQVRSAIQTQINNQIRNLPGVQRNATVTVTDAGANFQFAGGTGIFTGLTITINPGAVVLSNQTIHFNNTTPPPPGSGGGSTGGSGGGQWPGFPGGGGGQGPVFAARWVQNDGLWFRYTSQGVRRTGWFSSGGSWYFLNPFQGQSGHDASLPVGAMLDGWVSVDGEWYFLNPAPGRSGHSSRVQHGAMRDGWVRTGGQWYFLNPRNGRSGHATDVPHGGMREGWLTRGGNSYFLNPAPGVAGHSSNLPQGAMRTGNVIISGTTHRFNSEGRLR